MQRNRLDTLINNARRAMAEIGKAFRPEEQTVDQRRPERGGGRPVFHRNLDELKPSSIVSKGRQQDHRSRC